MKIFMELYVIAFISAITVSSAFGANNGLVLRYLFNEGTGKTIRDTSGNGFDGKVIGKTEWVQYKNRKVLKFRGGTYVDAGTQANSLIKTRGTLAIWCKPEEIVGSMIAWRLKGFTQGPKRLMLTFLTYRNAILLATTSDGWDRSGGASSLVKTGQWGYFVFTFTNKKMKLYVNGKLANQAYPRTSPPKIKGVPLHIGGRDIMSSNFQGEIAKVSIYNRDLNAKRIKKNYLAGLKRLNIKLPRTIEINTDFNAKQGKLNLLCNLENIPKISKKSTLYVSLNNIEKKSIKLTKGKSVYPVMFSTKSLTAGFYDIRAYVKDSKTNKLISLKSKKRWYLPKTAQLTNVQAGQKILNNMVTQLVAIDKLPAKDYQEVSFINPREGWVHISFNNKGQISVGIDTAKYDFKNKKVEIKRFLPAGEHKLRIWTKAKEETVSKLIIRSIPATILCGWPAVCYVKGFSDNVGKYNFNFFKNDVLPNITTFAGGARPPKADLAAWKKAGGRYFFEQVVPHLLYRKASKVKVPKPLTVDYAYTHWTKYLNNPHYPDYDGILVDEFSNGNNQFFNAYIKALKRMKANPEFKTKSLYVWCGGTMYTSSQLSFKFVRSIIEAGYKIATEFYLSEPPTVAGANKIIDYDMARHIRRWTKSLPEFASKAIVVLASYSVPPISCNINPHVDHRVFLDMQFQYLATAPECVGLWGVMMYKMGYTDEEIIRWFGMLFRHYCIEGKTELLSKKYGFTYNLNFIKNADFNDGLKYWTVKAAKPGSVKGGRIPRLHITQGRYHGEAEGDNYLMFKRCANKANRVSQKITGLKPGRLYSVKMIVNDYNDIVQGKSIKRKLGLRMSIDNVEMINEKSFVSNYYRGTTFLTTQYLTKRKGPYFDYYRYVFRAKGKTAKLTISDWTKADKPGGTIGQKVVCNFIEVQPYLESKNANNEPQFRVAPKCKKSFAKGNAFIDVGMDLSKYAGKASYMLILRDNNGKTARGYIGASGKGETLGSNLLKNGEFNKAKAWGVTNSTLSIMQTGQSGNAAKLIINKGANPEYAYAWQSITAEPGKLYKTGLYVKSDGKQNNYHVRVNNKGWKYIIRGVASDKWNQRSCYLVSETKQLVYTMSMYSNLFDTVFFQEVKDCSPQGVRILSSPDGKEQSWASIDKGFNYNDASDYAFAIVKCK